MLCPHKRKLKEGPLRLSVKQGPLRLSVKQGPQDSFKPQIGFHLGGIPWPVAVINHRLDLMTMFNCSMRVML